MAVQTRSQLKNYNNANINTNGANDITGAEVNTSLNNTVDSCVNATDDNSLLGLHGYDASRTYITDQAVVYSGSIYIALQSTTGAFNPAHWSKVSTTSDNDRLTVLATGTTVTFSSALGTDVNGEDYSLIFWCYDTSGNTIVCDISSRTQNGFTVTPAEDGVFEYIAQLI